MLARQKNRGFSLLDLLEAAREMVSGLQYAQSLAVTHQRPFGLKADVDGNWFRVFDYQYRDDSNPHHDETPPVDGYMERKSLDEVEAIMRTKKAEENFKEEPLPPYRQIFEFLAPWDRSPDVGAGASEKSSSKGGDSE